MQTQLTRLFGIDHPLVQGPFGGGLSSVALTAAVSNAGGLGSFGAHHLPPAEVSALVASLRAATARPFAINLWVPRADEPARLEEGAFQAHVARLRPLWAQLGVREPSMPAAFQQPFAEQVEAALESRPPVLSFVMGIPPPEVVARARAAGIKTVGTATTVAEAVALEQAGLDAVAASGSDSGGHRGSFLAPVHQSLVGTFSLVPQVADAVRIPVIAAGGVADGRGVLAALALGAAGVQVGTAFLVCEESAASEAHRAVLASERARTTVLTRVLTGRLARGIPNRFIESMAAVEAEVPPYPVQNWLTQPLRRAAAQAGDAEHLSLWSGQAARLARRRPAAELVAELVAGMERELERLQRRG